LDYSTIDREKLDELPLYKSSSECHLQDSTGNGCAGDPPGYPTYFTRTVYTKLGNHPSRGPSMLINGRVVAIVSDSYEKIKERLRTLWLPLPLDHRRTRLWIISTYKHMNRCYDDPQCPEYDRPGTLIWPVPGYKLKQEFMEVGGEQKPKFHPDYLEAENKARQIYNDTEIERAKKIAIPDNHKAVRLIRSFYPDYTFELDLIDNPPKGHVGSWWETEVEQPTPETCAKTQRWGNIHPFNGSWCQWCGWQQES
jgi:hypothetical protein